MNYTVQQFFIITPFTINFHLTYFIQQSFLTSKNCNKMYRLHNKNEQDDKNTKKPSLTVCRTRTQTVPNYVQLYVHWISYMQEPLSKLYNLYIILYIRYIQFKSLFYIQYIFQYLHLKVSTVKTHNGYQQ